MNRVPLFYQLPSCQPISFRRISSYVPLLQHEGLQVPVEDRILDGIEDDLDVLRVDRGGEVVEQRLPRVPLHRDEHVEYKILHVLHGMWITRKLWKV